LSLQCSVSFYHGKQVCFYHFGSVNPGFEWDEYVLGKRRGKKASYNIFIALLSSKSNIKHSGMGDNVGLMLKYVLQLDIKSFSSTLIENSFHCENLLNSER